MLLTAYRAAVLHIDMLNDNIKIEIKVMALISSGNKLTNIQTKDCIYCIYCIYQPRCFVDTEKYFLETMNILPS
jgi:hypothetical protein